MWNTKRQIIRRFLVLALVLSPYNVTGNDIKRSRKCSTNNLTAPCGSNERCIDKAGTGDDAWCECLRDYELIKDECVPIPSTTTVSTDTSTVKPDPKSNSSGSSVAAGLLVPTFLVALGALIFFSARRYKWLQRFRQYRQNRYGNVLVTRDDDDDDDDDPPIA